MGRAASSLIKRPIKNWNVENRAQRFIDKHEKPEMAPRHPSSKEYIDRYSQEHTEFIEEQAKKNTELAKMLDGLVVNPEKFGEISSTTKKKALPEDRNPVEDPEFGYLEPEVIRPGKCTIRQAMEFLGNHYSDPEQQSAAAIAKQYNLDKDRVSRVLQHFSVFLVQIPGQKTLPDSDPKSESRAFNPSHFRKHLDTGTKS